MVLLMVGWIKLLCECGKWVKGMNRDEYVIECECGRKYKVEILLKELSSGNTYVMKGGEEE